MRESVQCCRFCGDNFIPWKGEPVMACQNCGPAIKGFWAQVIDRCGGPYYQCGCSRCMVVEEIIKEMRREAGMDRHRSAASGGAEVMREPDRYEEFDGQQYPVYAEVSVSPAGTIYYGQEEMTVEEAKEAVSCIAAAIAWYEAQQTEEPKS